MLRACFLTFEMLVPCSCEDAVIPAHGRKLVKTGIAIHTPPGTYGRVAPRSGLAVNHFIDVGAGVIDEDYRGEVRVLLFNHEAQDFQGVCGVQCQDDCNAAAALEQLAM